MDVNQIFKDLAVMIHDQGEMIGKSALSYRVTRSHLDVTLHVKALPAFSLADSIEANVESAEVHVDRGAVQLQKAAYYQVTYNLLDSARRAGQNNGNTAWNSIKGIQFTHIYKSSWQFYA